MTAKRMRFLQELLTFVGLGQRLHLEWISSAEARKFVRVVTDFTEKIRALGPIPIAGFKEKIEALGPRAVVDTAQRRPGSRKPMPAGEARKVKTA